MQGVEARFAVELVLLLQLFDPAWFEICLLGKSPKQKTRAGRSLRDLNTKVDSPFWYQRVSFKTPPSSKPRPKRIGLSLEKIKPRHPKLGLPKKSAREAREKISGF